MMEDNKVDELSKKDAEVLNRIVDEANPEERKVIMRKLSITKKSPLPDAKEFEAYEKVLPGAGDRILRMAENEQKNRIDLNKKEQENFYKSNDKLTIIGVISSMVVSVSGITGAVILGVMGQPWTAGVIGSLSLGSIVANILKATSRHSE